MTLNKCIALISCVLLTPNIAQAQVRTEAIAKSAELRIAQKIKERLLKTCDGNLFAFEWGYIREYKNPSAVITRITSKNPTKLEQLNNPRMGPSTDVFYYFNSEFSRRYDIDSDRYGNGIDEFLAMTAPKIGPWQQSNIFRSLTAERRQLMEDGILIKLVRINGIPQITKVKIHTAHTGNMGGLFNVGSANSNGREKILNFFNQYGSDEVKDWTPLTCDDFKNPSRYIGKIFLRDGDNNYPNFIEEILDTDGRVYPAFKRAGLIGQASSNVASMQNNSTKQAIFGAAVREVDMEDEAGKAFGALEIDQVFSGSAAERAGIRSNDLVVEFNGVRIVKTTDLTEALYGLKAGKAYDLLIYRRGYPVATTFTPISFK